MKCWKTTEVLAVAVLLLCAASAVAAATSSKTRMTVIAPVSVGGKTLAPGNYQVTWEGSGKVQLSFVRAKKVVATAPATIQPRRHSACAARWNSRAWKPG